MRRGIQLARCSKTIRVIATLCVNTPLIKEEIIKSACSKHETHENRKMTKKAEGERRKPD